jgi:radical SAM-linked protein
MFYTQGFHPKPDMIFAPALSLGIPSLDEYVDLKLVADVDPIEAARALSAQAQTGLAFLGGARLGGNDPALGKVIDLARYVVALPATALAAAGGVRALHERIQAFAEAPEAVVLRRIDGVGKKVNVRAFVRAAVEGDTFGAEALERAGLLGDYTHLTVDIDVGGNGSAKIAEFMEVLLRTPGEEFDAAAAPPWLAIRAALGLRKSGVAASARLDRPMEIITPVDLVAVAEELRGRRAAEAASAGADGGAEAVALSAE